MSSPCSAVTLILTEVAQSGIRHHPRLRRSVPPRRVGLRLNCCIFCNPCLLISRVSLRDYSCNIRPHTRSIRLLRTPQSRRHLERPRSNEAQSCRHVLAFSRSNPAHWNIAQNPIVHYCVARIKFDVHRKYRSRRYPLHQHKVVRNQLDLHERLMTRVCKKTNVPVWTWYLVPLGERSRSVNSSSVSRNIDTCESSRRNVCSIGKVILSVRNERVPERVPPVYQWLMGSRIFIVQHNIPRAILPAHSSTALHDTKTVLAGLSLPLSLDPIERRRIGGRITLE